MKFCCYTLYSNRKKKCNKCNKLLPNIIKYNSNILNKLNNDMIQNIIYFYFKSKFMFYYADLMLVSKKFYYNFNEILNCNHNFKNYDNSFKSIYFIKSNKFKIKFAKIYISNDKYRYNILFGNENLDLATHKSILDSKNIDITDFKYLQFLI